MLGEDQPPLSTWLRTRPSSAPRSESGGCGHWSPWSTPRSGRPWGSGWICGSTALMTPLAPAACWPQEQGPGRLSLTSLIVRAVGEDTQLCPAAAPGKSLLGSVFLGWGRGPRAFLTLT